MNQPLPVFASPLTENLELWEKELESDCDKDFLLDGIRNGFRITTEGSVFKEVECQNYRSATHGHKDQVEEQIYNDLDGGNYILADTKPTILSSLGAIPKSAGGIRLIHDASHPEGANLNSYATINHFKYDTIDKVTKLIPPNSVIVKIDLKSA